MSLVYIDDAARGHVLAAENGQVGECYILAGTVGKLTEFGRLVCRLAGRWSPPTIPAPLAAPYALGGEALSRLTRRPPVLSWETYRLTAHGFPRRWKPRHRGVGPSLHGPRGRIYADDQLVLGAGLAQTPTGLF